MRQGMHRSHACTPKTARRGERTRTPSHLAATWRRHVPATLGRNDQPCPTSPTAIWIVALPAGPLWWAAARSRVPASTSGGWHAMAIGRGCGSSADAGQELRDSPSSSPRSTESTTSPFLPDGGPSGTQSGPATPASGPRYPHATPVPTGSAPSKPCPPASPPRGRTVRILQVTQTPRSSARSARQASGDFGHTSVRYIRAAAVRGSP
jgi:hypothetical protein